MDEHKIEGEFDDELKEIQEIEDPEDDNLKILCKGIKKRLKRKLDLVIALSGEDTGIGKSTLGIEIGQQVDPEFDLIKNIAYLPREQEIKDKFRALNKFGCFDIDEAIKSFYKLNWQDKFQKLLNQDFMTNRKGQYKCTELLVPRFIDLNEFFRNYKVKINIYIPFRGIGIIYTKNPFPCSRDPWGIDENTKLMMLAMKRKRFSELKIEDLIMILKKSKNYGGVVFFDPLPKELEDKYMEIFNSEKAREELEEGEDKREDERSRLSRRDLALAGAIKCLLDSGMTQQQVADKIGMKQERVCIFMKMIKETLPEKHKKAMEKVLN